MARDNQRKRLYDAEQKHSLWQKTDWLHEGGDSASAGMRCRIVEGDEMSLDEIREWINGLARKRWFKNRWPSASRRFVRLKDGRGTTWARGDYRRWRLNLPKWARQPLVVLHEYAHLLTDFDEASAGEDWQPHGPEFAARFLYLIRKAISEEAYREMRRIFKKDRVKIGVLPKPVKSIRKKS
jgi:putative metallohydrolase (TIGR04338 family)